MTSERAVASLHRVSSDNFAGERGDGPGDDGHRAVRVLDGPPALQRLGDEAKESFGVGRMPGHMSEGLAPVPRVADVRAIRRAEALSLRAIRAT